MALQIPQKDLSRLEQLVNLRPSDLEGLYRALEGAAPALSPTEFTSRVAERSQLDRTLLTEILRFLLNLYWVSVDRQSTPAMTAEEVVRNAVNAKFSEPEGGWDGFKDHLRKFLALDGTLGVASKAIFVATQYPCHFHSARVLTDARPVFGSDPATPPIAFVLNHTLQLEVHADDKDKELFITLDQNDLIELRIVIDRAIAKQKSLREALSTTSIPILGWEDEE